MCSRQLGCVSIVIYHDDFFLQCFGRSPAAGFFNKDNTPDFLVLHNGLKNIFNLILFKTVIDQQDQLLNTFFFCYGCSENKQNKRNQKAMLRIWKDADPS